MITAEVQIHGYRKGHQLLASSVELSKDDQAAVDRLSDVAGPLRPKEQFAPYLSAYPLPSGRYYVVARTWQDHTVARAGCVRTMSVFIDAQTWSLKPPLASVVRVLGSPDLPSEHDAVRVQLDESLEEQLPPPPRFSASELLEALFLEDAKPVVIFDAPDPELIALRLLTALWPNIRRRFALSTFALSPRKIDGRDMDLVFAPLNAKAKFSDWPGRRVDGRSMQNNRHRWTSAIVRRVFEETQPKLLSDREISLLGSQEADSTAALRIALLWDELLDKLRISPTAALGLLDITNSGMVSGATAAKLLEPRLAEATGLAAKTLATSDAWEFVGAIIRKMQSRDMPGGKLAVGQLAGQLAERAPDGAIELLHQPDPKGAIASLIPSIAVGLGKGAEAPVEQALLKASSNVIVSLVIQGGDLANRVANDDQLIKKMGKVLAGADRNLIDTLGKVLLPYLVDDRQRDIAEPIFNQLDARGVTAELHRLGESNGFQAKQLTSMLIERAREVDGLSAVRDVLTAAEPSGQRTALLSQSLEPTKIDVHWLLDEASLTKTESSKLLLNLLERADDKQLANLLSGHDIGERVLASLPKGSVDMLVRVAMQDSLPMNAQVRVIGSVFAKVNEAKQLEIAQRTLERCLRHRFNGDETDVLVMLLGSIGAQLDSRRTINVGLGRSVTADIASRNLVAFDQAPTVARKRIVDAVDEIAYALQTRHSIDLDEESIDAGARIMLDADKTSHKSLLSAAQRLIPSLLRAQRQPVSPMIAALFPAHYRDLEKDDSPLDVLKLFSLFDRDHSKAARRELVDAFMSSSWRPGDLALTAYRCGDETRFLGQVAHSYSGTKYLALIEKDLDHLSDEVRRSIKRKIADIRSDSGYDFDL